MPDRHGGYGRRRSSSRFRRRDGALDVRLRRLRFAVIVAALAALIAYLALGGASDTSSRRTVARRTVPRRAVAPRRGAAAHPAQPGTASRGSASPVTAPVDLVRRRRPPHHRARPDPGALPQTDQLPAADTATFRRQMQALWRGIQRDSVRAAMPAFFPERAYEQLKAIGDPSGDFQGRLVADYQLDIGAAHALLGPGAGAARLIGVQVPESYAHSVPPGVCDNSVGYYEVPNARVVYRDNGEVRSFGIASLISWRGVWYVIHLGAILRDTVAGVVDDPSVGAGTSAYSGTC